MKDYFGGSVLECLSSEGLVFCFVELFPKGCSVAPLLLESFENVVGKVLESTM